MALRTRWRRGDRFLIRHKDSAIAVVEKKAGLLTVATESGRGENLLHLLRAFLSPKGRAPLYPVHRLDRVVSGLLVFARTQEARSRLSTQFREHTVERKYVAAVHGVLERDRGTFESKLVTDDRSLVVYSEEEEGGRGRNAITHWRVLERFERKKTTLVEVELETGLRNQIRVHFAEAGHPLLGERKYERAGRQGHERIFLHAAVLGFQHPITRQKMRFEAPLPPDLASWKRSLRP
jgi:23S rRNA pseudouridine1911/1915/1917 synthase